MISKKQYDLFCNLIFSTAVDDEVSKRLSITNDYDNKIIINKGYINSFIIDRIITSSKEKERIIRRFENSLNGFESLSDKYKTYSLDKYDAYNNCYSKALNLCDILGGHISGVVVTGNTYSFTLNVAIKLLDSTIIVIFNKASTALMIC